MAIDEKRRHVIQSCDVDKAVYCFDFDGAPVFKYTSGELMNPRGVAVDREGNICVCEYKLGCIHVISPSGVIISHQGRMPTTPYCNCHKQDRQWFCCHASKGVERSVFLFLHKGIKYAMFG